MIQRDAAALLGVAVRTYLYIERGKTRGGYTRITIPRYIELAVKGLDCEFGVHHRDPRELNTAYARAIVALEDQAGVVPTVRPMAPQPKRAPRVLPSRK